MVFMAKPDSKFSLQGIICILLAVISFTVQLSGRGGSKYIFKAWRIDDGLPQNSILSLIQTRDGYLWFGTELGLVRFNGIDLRIFNRWNTPALKKNRINVLFEDNNGRLWVGTDGGGLCSYHLGEWQTFGPDQGLNSRYIYTICQDDSDHLWLGTQQGLYVFKDMRFKMQESIPLSASSSVETLLLDRRGNIWVGTNQGLLLYHPAHGKGRASFRWMAKTAVTVLYQDDQGYVYVGTENGLILFRGEEEVERLTRSSGLSGNHVTAVLKDRHQQLWVGTFGDGLCRIKTREPLYFTTSNGLSDDFVKTLIEDREGNVWIGTYAGGIMRMKHSPFSFLTRQNGLPEDHVSTIWVEKSGLTWIGTRHRGLCKARGERILKTYSKRNGLSNNEIQALCKSTQGDLWIGTRDGLNQLREEKISFFTLKDGLADNDVRAIIQGRDGSLWIGTKSGLNQFRYGRIVNVLEVIKPFRRQRIDTLYQDGEGFVWVASSRGLSSIRKGIVRHFDLGDEPAELDVRAIREYPSGSGILWLATRNHGLLRFKGGEVIRYGVETGLHSNNIFSLNLAPLPFDKNPGAASHQKRNFMWMSSYSGIFRVSLADLNKAAANGDYRFDSILYNEDEGMESSECTWQGQPSVFQTDNGFLYFSTIKGLAILDLTEVKTSEEMAPVVIEDVFVNNRSVVHQKNVKIPEGRQVVEFYFSSLAFSSPQKSRFRYKLEGFESQWTTLEPGAERSALYINLSPGTYTFRVIAANNHGVWNQQGARFSFKVYSEFVKNNILVFILLLLLILVAVILYLRYERLLRAKRKRKKYQTSALTEDIAAEILKKLLAIMEGENIYLDPDLTLKKLSERLMVHYNHLSQIINEKLKLSFNDFINKYRIEEAKRRFADPREQDKTILEIAYDVGFYSKSVFNTAFKKFSGETPSQYKKKIKSS